MTRYLLDTNAWVDHLRNGPKSAITSRLLTAGQGTVLLCSVVVAELIYGAARSGATFEAHNREKIRQLQSPFDDTAAAKYGDIRCHLANQGQLIGPNDLMIAAIALRGT